MANIAINVAQSALQNVLNLVEQLNPSGPTSPTQVTAGAPSAATNADDASVNTQVTLTAVTGQGFTGSVTVEYGRITLAAEGASPSGNPTISPSVTDSSQWLATVATYYGFVLSEISWQTVPTPPETTPGTATGVIQASGSLLYEDGTFTVTLDWAQKTALLMHFDGSTPAAVATAATGQTFTVAGVAGTHETDTVKFGTGVYWGNANGSYFSTPDETVLELASDFTIEFWIWLSADSGSVVTKGAAKVNFNSTSAVLEIIDDSGTVVLTSPLTPASAWVAVAFVKHGTAWTLYLNGTSAATGTSSNTWGVNSSALVIGNDAATSYDSPLEAYIDELRISQLARYTANYTPATSAFTVD